MSFVLPFGPRHFYPLQRQTYELLPVIRARREWFEYNGHEDGGFKVHGTLGSRVVAIARVYRCHRSTPGVVWRAQLGIPSVASVPQIKTGMYNINAWSSVFFDALGSPRFVICVHSKNHNRYGDPVMCTGGKTRARRVTKIMNNSAYIFDPSFRTCPAPFLSCCN